MIIRQRVPAYRALLSRYLLATGELEREAVLLEASELAKGLLAERVSMDDMLNLHQGGQQALAAEWATAAAGTPQALGWQQLASGAAMPLMLTLVLPQQIDEQRRAERRWREERDKLAAVFEQTDDLVLMFDADGRIEYLNPAFVRATGWRLATVQARPELVWTQALPTRHTLHLSTEQARADGSHFAAAWSASPILDRDGQLLSRVCIGRDITQLQRVEEGLRQNDKLRAVATLASGVAHDFNNLLGSIVGLTELCQIEAAPGSQLACNLAGIQQASQRAAGLVGQLLSFSHERPPQVRPVVLGALLQGCEALLAASLPAGVSLHLMVLDEATALADADQIEQVLLNLVKNAGHAMRACGGMVRVIVDQWDEAPERCWARVRVLDHGVGIAPEVMPRIFEPFFTTKAVDEGSGLGLAAAYGIVRHHQGRLEAQSTPGRETVFSLLLPTWVP